MKQIVLSSLSIAALLTVSKTALVSNDALQPKYRTATGNTRPLFAAVELPSPVDSLADFRQLVPLTILQPGSKKAGDKYGIEFSGNCYECDLAALQFNAKQLGFINVCNKTDVFTVDNCTFTLSPGKLSIRTAENEFVFTRIEPVPVYELKITGPKLTLKNKRIARYYTPKKLIGRFKQHDCGGFDG